MDIDERWLNCVEHDPRSLELGNMIAKIDYENGDTFGLKFGGDGDNGEDLLYILDIIFELKDKENEL